MSFPGLDPRSRMQRNWTWPQSQAFPSVSAEDDVAGQCMKVGEAIAVDLIIMSAQHPYPLTPSLSFSAENHPSSSGHHMA